MRKYEYVNAGKNYCDTKGSYQSIDWDGAGWYRVTGQAGSQLSEHPYEWKSGSSNDGTCGTHYGTMPGETATREICYKLDCTHVFNHEIEVTNCNGYYVYKLPEVRSCAYRYCTQ